MNTVRVRTYSNTSHLSVSALEASDGLSPAISKKLAMAVERLVSQVEKVASLDLTTIKVAIEPVVASEDAEGDGSDAEGKLPDYLEAKFNVTGIEKVAAPLNKPDTLADEPDEPDEPASTDTPLNPLQIAETPIELPTNGDNA
ncbi:MAG: hypothetical protein ACTH32_06660 [Microbacterium gubbeenense]|uniref:hypothetical protein n=1 Tax=Microbacterium gubbeenense TaxID=159896 RepID=UPI003F96CB8B